MKMPLLLTLMLSSLSISNANAARILFFGDSQSVATYGPFGMTMNKLLRELPNALVTTHARCGSVMGSWYTGWSTGCGYYDEDSFGTTLPKLHAADANHKTEYYPNNAPTPKIVPIIHTFLPELIVVEMGGNYTKSKDPLNEIKSEVGTFITDVQTYQHSTPSKVECVWVGPPAHRIPSDPKEAAAFKKLMTDIVATIKATVEPTCEFFDSTLVTAYPATGGDGTHYSFPAGARVAIPWAEKAFAVVKTHYSQIANH